MVRARVDGLVVEIKLNFIGGIGDTTVPNYSGAMFVAGGSGVTFALSAVQDLVLAGDRSRTKMIEVIWSITDPGSSLFDLRVYLARAEPLLQLPWNILSLFLVHS